MRPATDAVPKELLPVYDTPLLRFALEEAVAAGARRIVLVSSPDKPAIESYIETLRGEDEGGVLAGTDTRIVHQQEALGLGHAVLCARDAALPGPVGVILPDDLILGPPCLAEMCDAFVPGQMKSLIAAQDVDEDQTGSYGIFRPLGGQPGSRVVPADGLVEKPDPGEAPSTLAAVGRYILSPEIWDILPGVSRGAGDEIQLTDGIGCLGGIHGFRFSGTRYDCGSKEGLHSAGTAYRASCLQPEPQAVAAE